MARTAPTYAEFIAAYPRFTSLGQPVVENVLSLASAMFDVQVWGDFFSNAVSLETAHNLTMEAMGGSGASGSLQAAVGAISGVSGAGVSTNFATPSVDIKNTSKAWYMKTGYGQQFLVLRDRVVPLGVMTC